MPKRSDADRLRECVGKLAPKRAHDRDDWIKVGMAIHSVDQSDRGLELWDQFSQRSPKYSPGECEKKWRGFRDGKTRAVSIATLNMMAMEDSGESAGNGRRALQGGPTPEDVQIINEAAPAPQKRGNWLWPTRKDAERVFNSLTAVQDDPEAVKFLSDEYGLAAELAVGWKVFNHPGKDPVDAQPYGKGIVYPGNSVDGNPIYKFRSLGRNAKGKRRQQSLHGPGGALVMFQDEAAPWCIVAGEEKGAAAFGVGYNVLCSTTGESALSEAWIGEMIGAKPTSILLANDNDETGARANQQTAERLELAGYPANQIKIIAWPDDAEQGYDLNDAAKADQLKIILNEAQPYTSKLPRCMPAFDFVAVQRPKLEYHIEGLLPYGGKMTFSATSKFGKSMWAIQTGLALAAGKTEWLGWKFGEPARVLYLQAEIMDALLEHRIRWMLDTLPKEINKTRAGQNFIIQEIAHTRPNLITPQGRAQVEALLKIHHPEIVILDPLAAIAPGLEENAAESMGAILDYFTGLTIQYNIAVILIHHHGKQNTSRGSSVFEAWPETDLQATFLADDNHSIAQIVARLRCTYNKGPVYWKTPTPEKPWFEPMPPEWTPDQSGPGRKTKYNPEVVRMALKAAGKSLFWSDLKDTVVAACGCSERKAQDLINQARNAGIVTRAGDLYGAV